MKQDAANHWKIKALGVSLAARLAEQALGGGALSPELSQRLAMGVAESLWIWTKRYYPRGDIGRADDETIAMEVGWDPKDARWLIATFCKHRLIDESKRHRLILHDLSEHAEDFVRKALERAGISTFADGSPVRRDGPGRPPKRPRPEPASNTPAADIRRKGNPPAPPNPIPPNPSQSNPSPPTPALGAAGGGDAAALPPGDRSTAERALRAAPWPDVSPSKADALLGSHTPEALLVSVARFRSLGRCDQDSAGKLVRFIERGDGEKLVAERAQQKREADDRRAAADWWAGATPEQRKETCALFRQRYPRLMAASDFDLGGTPALIGFIAERIKRESVAGTIGAAGVSA